jgi:hypothetical protein
MTEPRPVAKGLQFLFRCETKENCNVSKSKLPLNGVSRQKIVFLNKRASPLKNYRLLFQRSCAAYIKLQNMGLCKFSCLFVFLALQPILIVFSQPGSGL